MSKRIVDERLTVVRDIQSGEVKCVYADRYEVEGERANFIGQVMLSQTDFAGTFEGINIDLDRQRLEAAKVAAELAISLKIADAENASLKEQSARLTEQATNQKAKLIELEAARAADQETIRRLQVSLSIVPPKDA